MKVFLTGGTGFIGSHFINNAHACGHKIVAMRRVSSPGPRVRLSHEPLWIYGNYEEVSGDELSRCDILVHLAAHSANVPYDSLENCIRENVMRPLALLQKAVASGIKRFIVAGSCFEYGLGGDRYEFIPPCAPLEPTASYPTSKAAASICFSAFARENKLSMALLRIFQVYGEGELETRFWPSLRVRALAGEDMPMTSGEQIRDFIHVEDVARVFASALEWELKPGIPLVENVGSGRPLSLRAFAANWWEHWNARGSLLFGQQPHRPNEIMRFVPHVSPLVLQALQPPGLVSNGLKTKTLGII